MSNINQTISSSSIIDEIKVSILSSFFFRNFELVFLFLKTNTNDLNNNNDHDEEHHKSKIIKCKTNNQSSSSYNISPPNGSSSPSTIRSIDVPNNHASIKLHIRRLYPPSSTTTTTETSSTAGNLLCQTPQSTDQIPSKSINNSRRIIPTRRTSLIESDLSHITLPTSTVHNNNSIPDENILKKQPNGFKRKFSLEVEDKKPTKSTSNSIVQTRSSSRLKQKHHPNRRLSTEIPSVSTSDISTSTDDIPHGDYKYMYLSPTKPILIDNQCQTYDDIIETNHQLIQTNSLIKIDKSIYTDFIDQPLCENSTQTIRKTEQETQTTDLNCPNDSQIYLSQTTDSQIQCDRRTSPVQFNPSNDKQIRGSPFMDLSLTNSNEARTRLFETLIHTEEHPNGGGNIIRTYYNEFARLSTENLHLFVNYFFNLVYGEVNQRAKYSIGVLHDGARYLPDLVDYFSLTYPKMTVKTTNLLNSKEVLTTTMGEYRNRIVQTYSNGTFRYGPLMSISLVGTVTGKEECGKK
jgi:hypothetical protein